MGSAVPVLYWFDRFEVRIGLLPVVGELVHTEELNGEDTIEFESFEVPDKGDRLLWLDGGTWREHIVVRTVEPLVGPCFVYAESSLCEMLGDFVLETQLVNRTALQALTAVLAVTRWSIVSCADLGTAGCLIYHQNALWGLRRIAEVWGGELSAAISVASGQVASRGVRLDSRIGAWRGVRFSYGKNMAGCTRTVLEDEIFTALYGFGAGLPYVDADGNYLAGYRRKLSFADLNGGQAWVGDEDARLVWGRWNANRTVKEHVFGRIEFPYCTDPANLLALTRAALAEAVRPKVSYEVDVAALDGGEVGLGDTVAVVDSSRSPEWRFRARVVRRVRTFGEGVYARVTIGDAEKADYAVTSALVADVEALQGDVTGIDGQISAAASTVAVAAAVDDAIVEMDDLSGMEF